MNIIDITACKNDIAKSIKKEKKEKKN
jgi:hypothetical protein